MRAKRQSWCLYLALFLILFSGSQSPCLAQFSFLSASRNLEIYYATSRFNESPSGRPLYSGARHLDIGLGQGSTEYGTVSFVTPPGNNASIASCPSWENLRNEMESRDNYWKNASLGQINRLGDSDFYNRVRNFHGLICIYVHGYDMTFDEASREMAELADEYQRRSNQPIMPILFTWPSSGNKADYNGDEASLEWSERPFREFINRLAAARSYDSSIDLVAHSMGSRLAFWYGMVEGPRLSLPPFRNVFLSCADTDYHTAEQRKDDLQKCLSGCLYVLTNDDDGPLATSALMHVQPRLGRPIDSGMATATDNRTSQPLNKQNLSAKASSLLSANSQTILNSVENILISKAKAGNSNNKNSLTQMAMDLLGKNSSQPISDAEVQAWLNRNPYLARDYGVKAKLIDDTGLVTVNSGHRIAWPLLVGLMQSSPTFSPFVTAPVFKKPDNLLLREMGGTPTYLYRYNKIDLNRLQP